MDQKKLLAMIFAVLFLAGYSKVALSSDSPEKDSGSIYKTFKEMRLSINDLESNPAKYFSANANLAKLGLLLTPVQNPGDLIDILRAVRNQMRFSENLTEVHHFEEKRTEGDKAILIIQYSDWKGCPQKEIAISYVFEASTWKIDGVTYKRPPSKKYTAILDSFTAPPVMTVAKCRK